jgi:thymidylate synthase (FAD)
MKDKLDVLDNGFIRLDASDATDLSVVNAARVSFGIHTEELSEKDKGLIGFLMREKHGTPFEHNFFRFHVKAPIFVVREWFRHRIGWSYNEYSGRYAELNPEAYLPSSTEMRTQVGKPGAYEFEQMSNYQFSKDRIKLSYMQSFNAYHKLLEEGVAKEVARLVLPVGTYTEFYATTNARALMNFIKLRGDETAQWEIRQYANTLEYFLQETMPVTYSHFVQNEKVAP